MKHLLLLIMITGACLSCFAQTGSPAVIITSGAYSAGNNASLSWTIGESLIESHGEEDLMLLQGFQEPEDFPVAIPEYYFEGGGLLVYPTMTHDLVHVILPGEITGSYSGEIIDLSGKVLSVTELQSYHSEIMLEDISCGMYLLKITRGQDLVKEIKIIRY